MATAGSDQPGEPAQPVARTTAPSMTGIQGIVERQILQAQARGAFDNLPGAGRPLPDSGGPHDENWWLAQHLLREGVSGAAFLPPALALRKEVEDLPDRVRLLPTEAQVRLAVDRLNDRILDALRKPGEGPPVSVMAVDVEEIVLGWRFARIAPSFGRHPGSATGIATGTGAATGTRPPPASVASRLIGRGGDGPGNEVTGQGILR